MVSLILFLFALAAPVQPAFLTVEHSSQGNVITWSEVGNVGSDQTLYLLRLRAGESPKVLSAWTSAHNPPASGAVDPGGLPCDGYELRLSPGWKTVYRGACVVYLPEVVSP